MRVSRRSGLSEMGDSGGTNGGTLHFGAAKFRRFIPFISFPRSAWERNFSRRSASRNGGVQGSRRRASEESTFPTRSVGTRGCGYFGDSRLRNTTMSSPSA
jgi:hypothetical protein